MSPPEARCCVDFTSGRLRARIAATIAPAIARGIPSPSPTPRPVARPLFVGAAPKTCRVPVTVGVSVDVCDDPIDGVALPLTGVLSEVGKEDDVLVEL